MGACLIYFFFKLYSGMEPVPVFPEFRVFFSSPLSSPAIAVLQAIFSRPKIPAFFSAQTCRHFFPARICRHFVPIRYYWHFFSGTNLPKFFFRPEIAGIFSDPKLPAYLPMRDCRHFFRPETAGIFFDTKLLHLSISFSFFSSMNKVCSSQSVTRLANDPSCL